jgi:MULE transposase domain
MDCTYKPNHFHIPLLDILSSTGLNHTFFAAFIFLSSKKEETYFSILKIFREVIATQEISFPNVIVTDRDLGLMNTISFVFL